MAKKETSSKKEVYTIQLEPELVNKIEDLAKKIGLTKSQLMRNFIKDGYEDASILYKIGVIPAVIAVKKINDYKYKIFKQIMEKPEIK